MKWIKTNKNVAELMGIECLVCEWNSCREKRFLSRQERDCSRRHSWKTRENRQSVWVHLWSNLRPLLFLPPPGLGLCLVGLVVHSANQICFITASTSTTHSTSIVFFVARPCPLAHVPRMPLPWKMEPRLWYQQTQPNSNCPSVQPTSPDWSYVAGRGCELTDEWWKRER